MTLPNSTPPHPVEEAVARVRDSLTEAALRIVFADGSEWRLVPHDALETLLSALERQKEALERIAAEGLHEPLLLSVREIREVARSALGGQHG